MTLITGKPWHETQQQKLAEDDLRRLHAIRAACRSLRDELHRCDWFSSVSHCQRYQTIIIRTVNFNPAIHREVITRWDSFPVRYQPEL